ncbi:MAG: GxxExxY protein [Planctomycetes bacterium]|nr:GxxExxY protein [Planctomycetota bacterium]
MTELILKDESYQIIGACFEVYNELGCGFLEAVYQECLEVEFTERGIPFRSKHRLTINYKTHPIQKHYEADFLCFDQIIIELKAVSELTPDHLAQTLNYLHATRSPLGILVNFGQYPKLQYKRIALTEHRR